MTVSLVSLEEGYVQYCHGLEEPHLLLANVETKAAIEECLLRWYATSPYRPHYAERFNRKGMIYNAAIIVLDESISDRWVRYENVRWPDDPKYSGLWKLESDGAL